MSEASTATWWVIGKAGQPYSVHPATARPDGASMLLPDGHGAPPDWVATDPPAVSAMINRALDVVSERSFESQVRNKTAFPLLLLYVDGLDGLPQVHVDRIVSLLRSGAAVGVAVVIAERPSGAGGK